MYDREVIRGILREGLNLFYARNNIKWKGSDADLETSLFEYGFVARQPEKKSTTDEWQVLYKVYDDAFDVGWLRESDLDELVLGQSWASKEDVDSFFNYNGYVDATEWINDNNFISKLFDLLSYWGIQNIFGESYNTMNTDEANALLEKYS